MTISIVILKPVHIDTISPHLQFSILNKSCRFLLLAAQPRMNQGISVELSDVVSLHAITQLRSIEVGCKKNLRDSIQLLRGTIIDKEPRKTRGLKH